MKAHKPDTDQEFTLTAYVDGLECTEFNLPTGGTHNRNPNVVECFIPVSNHDQITLKGEFKGTILHGAIDLIADGSYLRDTRIEGAKSGQVKSIVRKIEFAKVLDIPIPPDHTSIYPPTVVVEGTLHTKPLASAPPLARGDELGVGSLAVVVSVNQKSTVNYQPKKMSLTCGAWKKNSNAVARNASNGGIPPTHELEVRVTDDRIHLNRQSKHRRHAEQTRFGTKPWATFIFYYRTRAALEEAKCVMRSDAAQELEADAEEDFVFGEGEKRGIGKKDANKDDQGEDVEMRDDGSKEGTPVLHGNSMFLTPAPEAKAQKAKLPHTEPPLKKQKLFGRSLYSRGNAGDAKERERQRDAEDLQEMIEDVRHRSPADEDGAAAFDSFDNGRGNVPVGLPSNCGSGKKTGKKVLPLTGDGATAADWVIEAAELLTSGRINGLAAASQCVNAGSHTVAPSMAPPHLAHAQDSTMEDAAIPSHETDVSVKEESPSASQEDVTFPITITEQALPTTHPESHQHPLPPKPAAPSTSTTATTATTTPTFPPTHPTSPVTPSSLLSHPQTRKRSIPPFIPSRSSTPNPVKKSRLEELRAKNLQRAQRLTAAQQNFDASVAAREEEVRKAAELEERELAWLERKEAEDEERVRELVRQGELVKQEAEEMRYVREMTEARMLEEEGL